MHSLRNRLQVAMGLASAQRVDKQRLVEALREVDRAIGEERKPGSLDEPLVLELGGRNTRLVLEPSPGGAIIMAMVDDKAAVYTALSPFDAYEVGDAVRQMSDDVPQGGMPLSGMKFAGTGMRLLKGGLGC